MEKRLSLEERHTLKDEALKTIEMVDNYEKQYDVTVFFWATAKNASHARLKVEEILKNIPMTTNIGDIVEVEY